MVFFWDTYGSHSNTLLQTIYFESYCIEHNFKFINFGLNTFSKYYGIHRIPFQKFFIKLLKGLRKFKLLTEYNYSDNYLIENVLPNPSSNCIVAGFYFRPLDLIQKYKSLFQNKYTLKPKYYVNNNLFNNISKINRENTSLIGLHLRKGDYKNWLNGKYYFTDDVFLDVLKKMEKLIKETGKEPLFIIFSNEIISETFKQVKNIIISKEKWYIDQFIMSKLDYLIGPPSTFTGWASYIGNVPLKYIESKNMTFNLGDFKIYEC